MSQFKNLVPKVYFDCIVDNVALIYIMKSKAEPANARIKRLLEIRTAYSFNIYYMKGKDIKLSNFLFRIKVDKTNPHETIPISFD